MKQIIDTHAHIYSDKFQEDLAETISRAQKIGVVKILMPNIDSESVDAMHKVNAIYPDICLPMMGIHPCSIKENAPAASAPAAKSSALTGVSPTT